MIVIQALLFEGVLRAEPQPGDLFREYTYANTYGDAGGAIRVGGKQGVSHPDRDSDHGYINTAIVFPHQLDLQHATRAEVVVEKILSHNGTEGLAIQWNDGQWIALPEPEALPEPRSSYYHHACITQPVTLDDLETESNANQFRLRVNSEQDWGWPQHLIYGVHLRVYYDQTQKSHLKGKINSVGRESTIGTSVPLGVAVFGHAMRVKRVDYLANYEGVNWAGDGRYRRWQYFYYHGDLIHHLGSAVTRPYATVWDTSWVPDQTEPIEIAARIVDDTDLIFMTPAVTGLRLHRPGLSVELCKPEDVPNNWVTRSGEYEQAFTIAGDPCDAVAARLCWSSWSPGYMNGIFVNGIKIIDTEGPRYRYHDHQVAINDPSILRRGKNTISTGKTPRYNGKMVHGMEVNWPGIQLLIQYRASE